MSELYPLLMAPHFDRRPWGARDLAPLYDRHVHPGEEPIGEVWLTWDECRVVNGAFGGATLGELCRRFGRDLVGATARESDRFPLLIKFLFPREKLSVQVHPDDETAQRQGEPCGKTECWYVLEAQPGAQVALGLKPGTSHAEFECSIGENRAEELLNWIDLLPGDMIYVDAGTVHTLGPGSVILETQQNSSTTYRLYDYGRPRPLHLRQGMEALKERTRAGRVVPPAGQDRDVLISARWFRVEKHRVDGNAVFSRHHRLERDAPQVLVGLDGAGVIDAAGTSPLMFGRGDAVVIPASLAGFCVRPQWTAEFLTITLPASVEVAEPETDLPGRESPVSG